MSIPRRIRWCVSNLVQPFDSFPRLLNFWPPTPPPPNAPWGIQGRLRFSLCPFPDESADVNQSWCQSDSFPDFWIVDPLKPPKCPPCVSRGNLFGVYPFPYEFAHVCQIWYQSAQPFGSFSRICAKVSSAFRRCTRGLAQKHAKKQHLYIDNYISGPNMLRSTSLSFVTAIFLAFSGTLAEELMILCRSVTTEWWGWPAAALIHPSDPSPPTSVQQMGFREKSTSLAEPARSPTLIRPEAVQLLCNCDGDRGARSSTIHSRAVYFYFLSSGYRHHLARLQSIYSREDSKDVNDWQTHYTTLRERQIRERRQIRQSIDTQ